VGGSDGASGGRVDGLHGRFSHRVPRVWKSEAIVIDGRKYTNGCGGGSGGDAQRLRPEER
jgi:hypothetical protein